MNKNYHPNVGSLGFNSAPDNHCIRHIEGWLKEESMSKYGQGFYGNLEIIRYAHKQGRLLTLDLHSQSIGFAVWSESDEVVVNIDIFEIHPSYRTLGYGKLLFRSIQRLLESKEYKVLKLFCMPQESHQFWESVGFLPFPESISTTHEFTYYYPLSEIAELSPHQTHSERIEVWDKEPNFASTLAPKWTWVIERKGSQLSRPIILPCNKDWKIRWSIENQILEEDKIKRFTPQANRYYKSGFLYIANLDFPLHHQ